MSMLELMLLILVSPYLLSDWYSCQVTREIVDPVQADVFDHVKAWPEVHR